MKLSPLIIALLMICSPARLAEAETPVPTIDLSKSTVKVSAAFVGTDVLIFGTTERVDDLIVVIFGPSENVVVRKKKRISGIWVNREHVVFQNVPSFYAIGSTQELSKITEDATLKNHQIGLDKLRFKLASGNNLSPSKNLSSYKDALIRDKKKDKLFSENPLKIDILEKKLFKISFHFPNNMATGNYIVKVFSFQNKQLINSVTKNIKVERMGISDDIYQFAHNQSALYGILAILIAVLSGWLAAIIFRRI